MKPINFNYLILLLILSIFAGCEQNDSQLQDVPSESYSFTQTIPLEVIKNQVLNVRKSISTNIQKENLKIEDVYVYEKKITSEILKQASNNDTDTLIYLINFENNKGYAIAGAHLYQEPIYCICDTGSLNIGDSISESNLVPILKNIETHANHINNTNLVSNHSIQTEPNLIPKVSVRWGRWELAKQVGPLLKTKYGQWDPYDNKLDKINGKLPPAGCVATAVAQIMAYHKYPKKYQWEIMIKKDYSDDGKDQLATLFKELGALLHMDYSLDGSGADDGNVPPTLMWYGYTNAIEKHKYDIDVIKHEVDSKRPIYIGAYSEKKEHHYHLPFEIFDFTTYDRGHAFVLDGYKIIKRKVWTYYFDNQQTVVSYQYRTLVHANLGWSGSSNGYYANGIFDVSTPIDKDENTFPNTTKDCYQYDFKLYTNIQP